VVPLHSLVPAERSNEALEEDRGPDLAANLTGERSKHGGYALLIYQPGIFEKCVDLAIYARVMRECAD
jgi:hypothetical protein